MCEANEWCSLRISSIVAHARARVQGTHPYADVGLARFSGTSRYPDARVLAWRCVGLRRFALKNSRTVENDREFLGNGKARSHRPRGGCRPSGSPSLSLARVRAEWLQLLSCSLVRPGKVGVFICFWVGKQKKTRIKDVKMMPLDGTAIGAIQLFAATSATV